MKDRFRYRVPFYKYDGTFAEFEYTDFIKGLGAYNAGVVYRKGFEQCIGVKDKNGKLIYEGDILKDKYGALHPISWNVKGFYEADTFAVAGFYNAIQEDMEVIANIHENPELLEADNAR